ncbi:MAG: glycosyl transferase [Solibacillus isronensis]
MKKLLLLFIVPVIIWFGCSTTVIAEFAVVKEIKENSIIIENWGGETKEIAIPKNHDYSFELEKEYFFNYEIKKSKKAVLISAEPNEP